MADLAPRPLAQSDTPPALLAMNYLPFALLLVWTALASPAAEEQDLIALLQSNASVVQKCDACQRLRVVGTVKAVPALAALLGDERLGHAARHALEGLPFPEAGAALRQALDTATGPVKAGLADSLGWRRDTAAVPQLRGLLQSGDAALATVAALALGRIGGAEATAALRAAQEAAPAAAQAAIQHGLLQCAEHQLTAGDASGAARLYRELYIASNPLPIRAAAWRGLVLADPGARAELVPQALLSADRWLRSVALQTVRQLHDTDTLRACLRQWAALPQDSQLAVLDAALPLGPEAQSVLRAASASIHAAVRTAAWQALGNTGDASAIPALAQAAAIGDSTEREAAREALAQLRGPGVREALLLHLGKVEPPEQAELLRALGERGDEASAHVLLSHAAAGPPAVRRAALESLRKLALAHTLTPLLELAAKSPTETDREAVLRALEAVCRTSADKEQTASRVVEALERFPAAERRQVLPLLADLATPTALEAVLAATRDPDVALVKEAVHVLSQWPTAAPAPRLLELAQTSLDPAVQTLALRGALEVAAHEPDLTRRLALVQQALGVAKRPEEKKQALGLLGQTPTPAALQATLALLKDPSLAEEAGLAALTIAEKLRAADPNVASHVAAQVLAHGKSPEMIKRAWALRGQSKINAPFIRDWLVSGPYSRPGATGAEAVFTIAFPPEQSGPPATWKPAPAADMINLLALFPDQANCAAYLKTTLVAPEACEAVLLLGSDDGVKVWLNGAVVHSHNVDRGAVVDQDIVPIKLQPGANALMLKVTQGGGGWAVCARVVTPDGQPVPGLRVEAR